MEGMTGKRVMSVATGAYHTVLLTMEGHVYVCGIGVYGQLGLGTELTQAFTPVRVDQLTKTKGEAAHLNEEPGRQALSPLGLQSYQ